MYTNLNRKGWVYVSKDKMPQGGPKMGAGGKVPGGPKPKNMKKTIGILLNIKDYYS